MRWLQELLLNRSTHLGSSPEVPTNPVENSEVPGTDPLSCGGNLLSTLAVCLLCVAVSVALTVL